MSITPVYFDRHRGFAMGVILAGSGIGGVVIAPVLQVLLDKYGISWALRILGIWNLFLGIPVACVVRHRTGFGSRGRTRINMGLVKRGSLLLAINSGVNSLSRISMGILADNVGRQNTMIASVFLSGLSVFALWYNAPRARYIAFVVLYAIYAGGYNALLPTTITDIYGVENYASVNGFVYFVRGLGSVLGAPLAGVILGTYKRSADASFIQDGTEVLQGRFNNVVIYSGILLVAAGICVSYVRWLDARDKGRWAWKA
ncbi:hypothetical protein DXG01_015603 [Tephrocybe rancida]|nr:hypothetical protein DXG01_015603 [Tephrocybe rancida]